MLLISSTTLALGEDEIQLPEGIPKTIEVNGNILKINLVTLKEKGLLVYGEPFGDYREGEYRYLGYTMYKDPYANDDFPPDADSGRKAHVKSWIINPWGKPYSRCEISPYNSPDRYRDKGIEYLQMMVDYYNTEHDNEWLGWTGEELINYLNIQSPPTDYCPGSARGWHINKTIWYQTFIIPPLKKLQLSSIIADITATPNPNKVEQGNTSDIVVTLDSSNSTAQKDGEEVQITSRRYWASTSIADLNDDTKGIVSTSPTYDFNVEDVPPNTTIYCKVRIYSQTLNEAKLNAVAEAETTVRIGTQGTSTSDMNADAEGVIQAEIRDSEKFDVTDGIPSSENLYINIIAKEYLYEFTSPIENTGSKEYPITVSKTYNLEWEEDHGSYETDYCGGCKDTDGDGKADDCPGHRYWSSNWVSMSDTVPIQKEYTVTRDYSYWTIDQLAVYALDRAEVENEALPYSPETLYPQGYTPPEVDLWHSEVESDHIIEPTYTDLDLGSQTINGGRGGRPSVPNEDWTNEAENAIEEIIVKNDKFIFDTTTVIDGEEYDKIAPPPGTIPEANPIDRNILYKDGLTIEDTKPNGEYISQGTIYYTQIAEVNSTSPTENSQPIEINNVTVHTPVVCYAGIWNDRGFNQEINPDNSRASLILDRPSKIQLPTKGKHREIKGYGENDYAKYTAKKEVKFPFDVYIDGTSKDIGTYLKADTWHEVSIEQEIVDYYLPTWVEEGDYEVEYREIAINAPDENSTQNLANLELENYIATKQIPVRVIGRLYGFKITDINDYPTWEKIFRTKTNSAEHTGTYYRVGTKDQNGKEIAGHQSKMTVPILNGSHPEINNTGTLKTGYKFRFELNTIGKYYEEKDCINIKPRFYYTNKEGTQRIEVELWYSERFNNKENHFIKIGSAKDKENIKYIKLGDPYRNVPEEEIYSTSKVLGKTENTIKNQQAKLGWFHNIVLSEPLRTFIGDATDLPYEVEENKASKSEQKWYGEYYLPNTVYVTPKDYDVAGYAKANNGLNGKEDFWLKEGYIILNFDIETVKDGDFSNPVLSYYMAPNSNMWNIEGYTYNKTDSSGSTFQLQAGDILFYYANKKASDDYTTGGTH